MALPTMYCRPGNKTPTARSSQPGWQYCRDRPILQPLTLTKNPKRKMSNCIPFCGNRNFQVTGCEITTHQYFPPQLEVFEAVMGRD
ncbi:hypothetical protein Pcinc_015555 [Petrolisthes cinctipes]|uniref:Uncharacterized protein n=1 Tax=Petrolisthes cinctipes TaxID=88211 RepID=A0AAE1FST7_PETCI|nr:hypothetical protein Pcinc_015555 [Petrolisthes cinctipes]